MKEIKVKIINKSNNPLPEYKTSGSVGMDIRAFLKKDTDGILPPEGRMIVPTGLYMQIPEGYEAQIRPRSGLAAKDGITVLNTPGTIDSDYRGEIKVILKNEGHSNFYFNSGDRIAQLVFNEVPHAVFEEVDTLDETERGEGGFNSTGIK